MLQRLEGGGVCLCTWRAAHPRVDVVCARVLCSLVVGGGGGGAWVACTRTRGNRFVRVRLGGPRVHTRGPFMLAEAWAAHACTAVGAVARPCAG